MRTHQAIDRRSLEMVRRIVEKIDADPTRAGFDRAKRTCRRWVDIAFYFPTTPATRLPPSALS